MYNDIENDILERLFNEGKEINQIGNYIDLLELPLNQKIYDEIKEEVKEDVHEKPKEKLKEQ